MRTRHYTTLRGLLRMSVTNRISMYDILTERANIKGVRLDKNIACRKPQARNLRAFRFCDIYQCRPRGSVRKTAAICPAVWYS